MYKRQAYEETIMRKEISMLKISRIKSKRLKAHLLFAGIFSCLFLWLLFQFKWFGSSEGDAAVSYTHLHWAADAVFAD